MKHHGRVVFFFTILALAGLPVLLPPKPVVAEFQNPVEIKINPKIFDAYVGQYQPSENPDVVFSFFREAETYYIQATDQAKVQIFPASELRASGTDRGE